jgi:hypothetical protein
VLSLVVERESGERTGWTPATSDDTNCIEFAELERQHLKAMRYECKELTRPEEVAAA